MKVTDELLNRLAELSRLEFDRESRDEVKKDLGRMLDFVEKLKEVNTDQVDPLVYLTDEEPVLREDISVVTLTPEEALLNAPKHDSDYYKVPKVIEK